MQVVYTQNDHIMIRVSAEVVHPESGERDLTNVFFFTFTTSKPVPEVIPRSYAGTDLFVGLFQLAANNFWKNLVECRGHALSGWTAAFS
jgi:hypothetical protein